MINLSICTFAFRVETDISNKWYRKMNGRKSILCSARDSYRIRLSKNYKGKLHRSIRQVFEWRGGHLKLSWDRFRLWEIFRQEIRSNEKLVINLSICTFAFRVETFRINGTEKLGRSGDSKKSRQYFERNICLRSFSSRFWANSFPYKSFMLLSS